MTPITRRAALSGLAAATLTAAAALAGCTPVRRRLTMACGEPGGLYLEFGELLRDELHRSVGADLELLATNGSAENLSLLASGRADIAITLADSAEGSASDSVAIGRVYQNYLQCLVRADGPVRSFEDLAGLRVSIGARGSGSSFTTRRLLTLTGMLDGTNPPKLSEHPIDEALDEFERDAIDAIFWSGGIPTPKLAELGEAVPLALVDLSAALSALQREHPLQYVSATVPLGVYGISESTATIGIPNIMLARADLPDADARSLVDALTRNPRALVPERTTGLQFLTPANLIDTGSIALHAGAKQRYRELYG